MSSGSPSKTSESLVTLLPRSPWDRKGLRSSHGQTSPPQVCMPPPGATPGAATAVRGGLLAGARLEGQFLSARGRAGQRAFFSFTGPPKEVDCTWPVLALPSGWAESQTTWHGSACPPGMSAVDHSGETRPLSDALTFPGASVWLLVPTHLDLLKSEMNITRETHAQTTPA